MPTSFILPGPKNVPGPMNESCMLNIVAPKATGATASVSAHALFFHFEPIMPLLLNSVIALLSLERHPVRAAIQAFHLRQQSVRLSEHSCRRVGDRSRRL